MNIRRHRRAARLPGGPEIGKMCGVVMLYYAHIAPAPFRLSSFLAILAVAAGLAGYPANGHAEGNHADEPLPAVSLDVGVTLAVGSDGSVGAAAAKGDALHAESVARHQEYLRGLTASYRLNAYTNYRIAEAIIGFVTTGEAPPAGTSREVVERSLAMRADLPDAGRDSEQTQRLLVRAFTQRHLNGYADLMWARWIERVNRLEPVLQEELYGTAAESGRPDLLFWTYLLRGSVEPAAAFVERYEPFTLSDDAVVNEIVQVQHANRRANRIVVDKLLHAGGRAEPEAPITPKSALLIAQAEQSAYPREFIRGAVAAQRGARRWDGAFERLLRWRF
ncbi:MAG: hypothetical protein ACLFO1_03590 [Spirochaetaceae bacterium]